MMKEKELMVLEEMRGNSRKSIADISRNTDIPVSTVFDIIKKNEKFVNRYVSLVDFRKMGYGVKVMWVIDIKDNKKFKEFINYQRSVNTVCLLNENSYMVECIFKDMLEQSEFTEKIFEFGDKKQEISIIEDIKREGFILS